jgi:hypothetical protein
MEIQSHGNSTKVMEIQSQSHGKLKVMEIPGY